MTSVHPIEEESYRILGQRLDLSRFGEGAAAVVARAVHATAEPQLAEMMVVDDHSVEAGVRAIGTGAPVLCDVEMVRAGISGVAVHCAIAGAGAGTGGDGASPRLEAFPSRTAAAMSALCARHPEGAVVVVGCAPTALEEVNRLIADDALRPSLVVGVPVGFVGAEAAKEHLLEVARAADVPVIVLRGERGGAAVAAAVTNALVRLSAGGPLPSAPPACLFIGHGTRSPAGESELRRFAVAAADARPTVPCGAGFIEFVEPGLDEAVDALVASGARSVVAVPLVLLGAGHMKDDGPAALERARARHRAVTFSYARELGLHPEVLEVVAERARECSLRLPGGRADALVVVGRGSTDPDANADLAKAARLLADGRDLTRPAASDGRAAGPASSPPLGRVLAAYVSLAAPGVDAALDECAALGARRIAVVPYFLFDGLLVERIRAQASSWATAHPEASVEVGAHMGVDDRLVSLAWERYDEARAGSAHMNCDGCLYRVPLPGYATRAGTRPGQPQPHTHTAGRGADVATPRAASRR